MFRLRAAPDTAPTRRRRRRVERLIADVDLSDVAARTDDELARVLRTFRHERSRLAEVHERVAVVLDRCGDELARRAHPDEPAAVTGSAGYEGSAGPTGSADPAGLAGSAGARQGDADMPPLAEQPSSDEHTTGPLGPPGRPGIEPGRRWGDAGRADAGHSEDGRGDGGSDLERTRRVDLRSEDASTGRHEVTPGSVRRGR